jgi:hypothetical protein
MIAPAVGELVAGAISGLEVPLPREAFSLDGRFHDSRSEGLFI